METNNKPTTVKDVLEDVKAILGNISIPATQIESIGIPVAKAINGIKVCIDVFNREEELDRQQQEAQEEPEIEIVPVEESAEDA